ncbi:extracellular solute-binding protein [Paenibacillus algicola]|uniref:Extracellular solute-binding protein n=1 Tax=Paenibacillus algicola TaxID=2565926 RepID=A0A4P8XEZ4_9BACL|nr:extracellular solute-binding protein [Paenibacillus algicola]QCT00906.1 extracellular solute-binding protein [Paenibacillus algicola]
MKNKASVWLRGSAALLLSSALIVSGCSKESTSAGQGGTSSPSTPAVEEEKDKKHTLSIASYHIGPTDKDGELVKYANEKYNVELDILNIENNKYEELLNLKFASGEIPDRMQVRSFGSLQKYIKSDVLAEIPEDLLKQHAPTLYASLEKSFPGIFEYSKIDGKLYGIPYVVPQGQHRAPLVYRGDWMKNVGVEEAPKTLEQFEELMYKFATEDPDGNGKKDTYGLSYSAMAAVFGAFGYMPDIFNGDKGNDKMIWQVRDDKLVYSAIQPEMKEALTMLNQWFKDGIIDPEFITGENQGGNWALTHAFINGRIGTSGQGYFYHWIPQLGSRNAGPNNTELGKLNSAAAEALVQGEPPVGEDGKRGMWQQNMMSGSFVSFGKQVEKDPDKMIRMLEMLETMNATYQERSIMWYGMENKHWHYQDEDGVKVATPIDPEHNAAAMAKLGGHLVINPFQMLEHQDVDNKMRNEFGAEHKLDEGGIQNELFTALESEGKYRAELDKLQDEAYISIITGDKPISYFDEFVEKWRKAGGEQLEKEANEWYSSMK